MLKKLDVSDLTMGANGPTKLYRWFQTFSLCALLLLSTSLRADEVLIYYLDDAGETQILTIDAKSPDADNTLAATLILQRSKILVMLNEQEDLEVIAAAVAAQAPDAISGKSVSNTILGVGVYLGGRSIQRVARENQDAPIIEPDVPPISPPIPPPPPPPPSPSPTIPPPSSSVVSPN